MSGGGAWPLVRWPAVALVYGLLIEIARRVALAAGVVSRPNPIVSAHRRPVPYLGGVGLILGYAIALVWVVPGAGAATGPQLARLVTALALMTLGTWDDLSPLGPWPKLNVEALLCGGYLLATGEPWGTRFVIELGLMVMLVNAYNLIDVMDGLLCVTATAAFLGLLGARGTRPLRVELEALAVGMGVLFLFNRPPARIYAGDAGSLPIGFLVAALVRSAVPADAGVGALALLGVCAVPVLEIALLVPARLAAGRSPLRGSPDHFALRLQDQLHWSRPRVLFASALVCAALALAPLAFDRLPARLAIAYAAAALALGAWCWSAVWRIPPRADARARPVDRPQRPVAGGEPTSR